MRVTTKEENDKVIHLYSVPELKKANFSDDDFLYIIGDVIDRNGDGGVDILLWLLEQPNAQHTKERSLEQKRG